MTIEIAIANEQKTITIDEQRIHQAIEDILKDANLDEGEISVALVTDEVIAQVHDEFLDDPTPTDVISFVLEREENRIEGEIVASSDTALQCSQEYGQSPENELLLYIIHGTLHLAAFDDIAEEDKAAMRDAEKKYMERWQFAP